MEERMIKLEAQVEALTALCINQQETINSLITCMGYAERLLARSTKIENDLFTYCKELRKEIEKLKGDEA